MTTRTFAIVVGACVASATLLLIASAASGWAILGIIGVAVLVFLALASWWWSTS